MDRDDGPVNFRGYQTADFDQVASLWTRINRELAPSDKRELFETYIVIVIDRELTGLLDIFSEAKRSAFWVVECGSQVVGSFGIQSCNRDCTELRRMYLDIGFRGRGVAQAMLDFAETRARALGFSKMVLSTAEIQKAADRFYRKNGFQHIRTETADTASIKPAGGGLARLHFEKLLNRGSIR
jgi:GNAT superfamily N-acetyltransferase